MSGGFLMGDFDMSQFRNFAVAVAAIGTFAAAPAFASTTIVYSGTLSGGYDATGVFGGINPDMTGLGFVATFVFDPALAGFRTTTPGVSDYAAGGTGFGNGSPMISAAIKINGVTKSFYEYFNASAFTSINSNVGMSTGIYADIGTINVYQGINLNAYFNTAPASFNEDFGTVAATGNGSAIISTYDYILAATTEEASFGFNPTMTVSYGIPVAPGVPEPASWALMIAGFGLVGAMRRRQRAAIAATPPTGNLPIMI
jgi:hypothetical protein